MISREQESYISELRGQYRVHADAAREFDKLADDIEAMGCCYSPEAHEEAVSQLRKATVRAKAQAEHIKHKLKETEGWQVKR